MPRRQEVDYKEMLKMIKDNRSQSEIMQKFGIKTSSQLNTHMVKAYQMEGLIPKLAGSRGGGAKSESNMVKVGKRGSIIIPKEMVEGFGFKEGEEFTVRQVKYGLQVRKAGAEEETGGEE